ncbi:MAG: cupin domain-containing protein [Chloroflexi bacterium]|nr:cupin domain-containing protein [Chloroflexota bacterium]MDA1228124.1 cupin domain-containing protein [Chloroflexota bacterium]
MSDKELGGVGSYVLFENEVVKVWQNDLQPGQSSDWHQHENNYLFVATVHGELTVEHNNGEKQDTIMKPGSVVMGEKESIHQLSNRGDTPYSSVIIEIK